MEAGAVGGENGSGLQPHFLLIPLMAPGHVIPMIDVAQLLASHGVSVSVVTTPVNASRLKSVIDRCAATGLPIRFIIIRFPSVEVGLPEGCETLDAIPSVDMMDKFLQAVALLRHPLEKILSGGEEEEGNDPHRLPSAPAPALSCLIGDFGMPWVSEMARSFGIPCLTFYGIGAFAHFCYENLQVTKAHEQPTSDTEPFVLPGISHQIFVTREQLPDSLHIKSNRLQINEEIRAAELASDGIVVNTFAELESEYVAAFKATAGRKIWTVGPASLIHHKVSTEMEVDRGNSTSIDKTRCLDWLEGQKSGSVLYVSFGSMARLPPSQLIEIGLGLEASNHPFIWVIKAIEEDKVKEKKTEWLAAFEERTKDRGLVIKGWAPQLLILSHPSTGGFLTHCGWNSTLEGVTAGVPMITWPMFGEQFLNEKLLVQLLGIGVSLGVKHPTTWKKSDNDEVQIRREVVAEAVKRLMDEGEEGEQRRKKVRELAEMSRKAMEEGGSSHTNLSTLIHYAKHPMHARDNFAGNFVANVHQ